MKLFICLLFSVFAASLVHTWEWERTARGEWRELAANLSQSDLRSLSSDR